MSYLARASQVFVMLAIVLTSRLSAWAMGPTASENIVTDQTAIQLVSATHGTDRDGTALTGLHMTLIPGWKTYWRSPGDAGLPVTIDWAGSKNLRSANLEWPVPHRFTLFGLDTFGYDREVLFPIRIIAEDPAQPVLLNALVRYLVCADICIPYEAHLSLTLPPGDITPTDYTQLINRFRTLVPSDGQAVGLTLTSTTWIDGSTLSRQDGTYALRVDATSRLPLNAPDVIAESPAGLSFGTPSVSLSGDGMTTSLTVPVFSAQPFESWKGEPVTLTVYDGLRALEQTTVPMTKIEVARLTPLLGMILIALLGGLILNAMPCVLPVLSLKLLGIAGQGGGERSALRRSFLASASGIVFSFWALAAMAISLRAAGAEIGWGVQFQHPSFIIAMALLLVVFAANLFGFFTINPPSRLTNNLAAIGQSPSSPARESLSGAFFTGAFATLLATPCSAPFLGTAISFALARGPLEIGVIFTALGVGFAAPYLLVALWPRSVAALPRPGAWMVRLKQILALALIGTAIWLLTILYSIQGSILTIFVTAMAVVLFGALGLLARRHDQRRQGVRALALSSLFAVFALIAAWLLPGSTVASSPSNADRIAWQKFDAQAIPGMIAQGKTIFVDVTADWCITCQVNKQFVLGDPSITQALEADGIVAMQADWTHPDAHILDFLTRNGRYGIPFNAVYGPGQPRGIILPELLTAQAVLTALNQVKK